MGICLATAQSEWLCTRPARFERKRDSSANCVSDCAAKRLVGCLRVRECQRARRHKRPSHQLHRARKQWTCFPRMRPYVLAIQQILCGTALGTRFVPMPHDLIRGHRTESARVPAGVKLEFSFDVEPPNAQNSHFEWEVKLSERDILYSVEFIELGSVRRETVIHPTLVTAAEGIVTGAHVAFATFLTHQRV